MVILICAFWWMIVCGVNASENSNQCSEQEWSDNNFGEGHHFDAVSFILFTVPSYLNEPKFVIDFSKVSLPLYAKLLGAVNEFESVGWSILVFH